MKSTKYYLLFFISLFLNQYTLAQQNYGVYEFPVKPGSKEWKNIKSYEKLMKATSIPKEILKDISTKDLIRTCLNYPLFNDIFLFENYKDGFEMVKNRFNGISELLERQDAPLELLKIIRGIDPKEINDNWSIRKTLDFVVDLMKVVALISDNNVLNKYSDESINILQDEIREKSIILRDRKKINFSIYYERSAFLIAKILLMKKNPLILAKIQSDDNFASFIKTGSCKNDNILMEILNLNIAFKKVLSDQVFNLTTPRNSQIPDTWTLDEFADFKVFLYYQDTAYIPYYQNVDSVDQASRTYNCHGYAWHPSSRINIGFNQVYNVHLFWDDGSYNQVEEADAEVFVYSGGAHSAIRSPSRSDYFRSKWFWGRLVDHPPDYTPWGGSYVGYARANDVGYFNGRNVEHQTISDGVQNAKPSQTINVYPKNPNYAYSVMGTISLATKQTLNFSAGVMVDLGTGSYITGKIVDQGVSWSPYNIKLMDGSNQIGQYYYLSDAFSAASAGQTIIIGSDYTLTSNLTIPSGVTLQINPGKIFTVTGVTLTLNSPLCLSSGSFTNATINVNSTFNCSGISFTNSAVNVSGSIGLSGGSFDNSALNVYGSSSLSGVNFQNGSTINLISSYNSLISSCTFSNTSTGIYISNSYPTISNCRFNNSGSGVSVNNYSSPTIYPGVFSGNSYDITGDNTSSPICGGSISFRNPGVYMIYSTYSGTIYAQGNYWGVCPFSPLVTNNVNYSSYSCTDMNPPSMGIQDGISRPEVIQAKKAMIANSSSKISAEPGMKEVDNAFLLFIKEKYSKAQTEFEKIMDKYPDNFAGNISLILVERCMEKSGKKDLTFDKINTISSKYSGKSVSKFAESRKIYQYILQGKFNDAVSQAAEVLKSISDTTLIKMTLFDLGTIYWFNNKDKNLGEQYYKELIKRFPYDMLSKIAQTTLGNGSKYNDKPVKSTGATPESLSIQNYPNPFNPSTKITYSIPENSNVSIMVYNSLGQKVSKLVDEYKNAGVYSIDWNPGNIPSGLYYYKIKTDKASEMKKMLYLK